MANQSTRQKRKKLAKEIAAKRKLGQKVYNPERKNNPKKFQAYPKHW